MSEWAKAIFFDNNTLGYQNDGYHHQLCEVQRRVACNVYKNFMIHLNVVNHKHSNHPPNKFFVFILKPVLKNLKNMSDD